MRICLTVALLVCVAALACGPARAEDADHGRVVFTKNCASCHQVAQPKNLMGPNLMGLVGRKIGGVDGYHYSDTLRNADGTWDAAKLDTYLTNPAQAMPGTKMINRLPAAADRADVIVYLATIKAP